VQGSVQLISWTSTGSVPSVKIEFTTSSIWSGWTTIATVTNGASGGTYSWLIPASTEVSTSNYIRVTSTSSSWVYESSAYYSIISGNISLLHYALSSLISLSYPLVCCNGRVFVPKAGVVRVTSPSLGVIWPLGTSKTISWQTVGSVSSVQISYKTDSLFSSTTTINANVPNGASGGSYTWPIPSSVPIKSQGIYVIVTSGSTKAESAWFTTVPGQLFSNVTLFFAP
jgi:hypothetical protein